MEVVKYVEWLNNIYILGCENPRIRFERTLKSYSG